MVNFDPLFFEEHENQEKAARDKLNEIWVRLSDGGKVLLELGEYDFSKCYGWIQDRFGVSWQIVPEDLGKLIERGSEQQKQAVTRAFLKMKKFEIAPLLEAFEKAR